MKKKVLHESRVNNHLNIKKCDVPAANCLIVIWGILGCTWANMQWKSWYGHFSFKTSGSVMLIRQKHTFVRILGDNFSALILRTAPLFGSTRLFSLLCSIRWTSAVFFCPFPFVPLSSLLFVLLGFLFKLLVGTARQGRAGDDSGGDCEWGARRRAGGGGWSGDRDGVPIAVLQGPVGGEGAGWRVSAGGTLVHGQVLGATALRGAGWVGIRGWARLLVRGCRGVGRDGEMGGRTRGDVGR